MTRDAAFVEQVRSTDADVRHRAAVQVAQSTSEVDLPLLFEMLGDRDWRVRKTIVEGLVRNPTNTVIKTLIDALHDPENAGKRNSATEALIRIGPVSLPVILDEFSQTSDPDVRLSLVNLMGDLRNEDALRSLHGLLNSEEDLNILSSAVASIGKYRQAKSIKPLLELLKREDLWLKFHVIEALGDIGDRSALPSVLPLYREPSLRKPVLEAVGKIGDVGTLNFLLKIIADEEKLNLTALRALMQIAQSDKPRVVESTERLLIQRKFREAFPQSKIFPLIEHMRSTPKREVKNFLLTFLGWSGDDRAVGPLLDELQEPESADTAAQALIDFGSQAAPFVLERLQSSDDDEEIALLLRVVSCVAGTEAIASILPFLDHDNAMIRRLSIETLGLVLDPNSIAYLLAKLDDMDVGAQQAAVNSISALVAAFPEAKPDTLTNLRKLLDAPDIPTKLNSLSIFVNIQGEGFHHELLLASKDEDPVIRQKAISLMGKFGEERFADQLVLSLTDEAIPVRLAAIQSIVKLRPEKGLDPLISSLEDNDIWIRTAAAQALGEYRHPSAIEPLVHHLRSDATPVKIAVIEALGKSESEGVKEILLRAVADDDIEIRRAAMMALARIPGEDVFARLMETLDHSDWRLRAAAAVALGARGDLRALESLHRRLEGDRDPFVQQSVVLALDRMGSRDSFNTLLRALQNQSVLDEVSHLLVRHKETYRYLLEDAWRTADSRQEVVIAAILQAMKGSS